MRFVFKRFRLNKMMLEMGSSDSEKEEIYMFLKKNSLMMILIAIECARA